MTKNALYQRVEEFVYVDYNHMRLHSFNGYRTPYVDHMGAYLINDIFLATSVTKTIDYNKTTINYAIV